MRARKVGAAIDLPPMQHLQYYEANRLSLGAEKEVTGTITRANPKRLQSE